MDIKIKIIKDKLFKVIIYIFSFLSILPLVLILFLLFERGFSSINIDFFTKLPPPPGEEGGGILNSLIGTFFLVLIASFIAIPIGVLSGIYIAEFKNKFVELLKIIVNVFQGVPSIVLGIVSYVWIVKTMRGFSMLSGGVALSLMMLPVVIKNTEETIKLLPYSLKEASYALGANYTKTVIKVLLPSSAGGIITGIVLGISRIAGETAPLLFTAFGNPFVSMNPLKPVDALPLLIFNFSMSPYEEWHRLSWGASLVLIIMVLALNIVVKMVGERWKARF